MTTTRKHLNLLQNATEFEQWLLEQGEGDSRFTSHKVSIERDEDGSWYVKRAAIVPTTNARGQKTVCILEQCYSL